jgi:hypothetical protein
MHADEVIDDASLSADARPLLRIRQPLRHTQLRLPRIRARADDAHFSSIYAEMINARALVSCCAPAKPVLPAPSGNFIVPGQRRSGRRCYCAMRRYRRCSRESHSNQRISESDSARTAGKLREEM